MSTLAKIISIVINEIRFYLIKVINPSVNIVVSNRCSLPLGALEVGKKCSLVINKGVRVRKNTLIAVRDNASLKIGNSVFVNRNSIITARKCITIEDGVTIGPNCCIYDHDHDITQRGGVCL